MMLALREVKWMKRQTAGMLAREAFHGPQKALGCANYIAQPNEYLLRKSELII